MAFKVDDAVDVKACGSGPWTPGKVTAIEETAYVVTLTTPALFSVLHGHNPSKYAPDKTIDTVRVAKASVTVGNDRIRAGA